LCEGIVMKKSKRIKPDRFKEAQGSKIKPMSDKQNHIKSDNPAWGDFLAKVSDKLSPKQIEALPHLIGARSLEEGRRMANVSHSQIYIWMQDKNFKDALDRIRGEVVAEGLSRLQGHFPEAVKGLTELTKAKEKYIKLRACELVINYYIKTREIENIEKRLSELEKGVEDERR